MAARQRKKPVLDQVTGSGKGQVSYGYAEMQGWRRQMEDAHCASTDPEAEISFFGVFDGHGGPGAARFCAQTLAPRVLDKVRGAVNDTTSIPEKFRPRARAVIGRNGLKRPLKTKRTRPVMGVDDDGRRQSNVAMKGAVKTAFLEMDADMAKQPERYVSEMDAGSYGDPGTTAVTLLVTPKKLVVSNVGDSRLLLVSKGVVAFCTKDHKPTDQAEEDRIVGAGGFVVSGRVCRCLAVARALGDHQFKQDEALMQDKQMVSAAPDVTVLARQPSDEFAFLGCDGIFDVMGNDELARFIRAKLQANEALAAICSAVVDKCFKKGSTDNMTALLVCFSGTADAGADGGADGHQPARRLSMGAGSPVKKPSWVTELFAAGADGPGVMAEEGMHKAAPEVAPPEHAAVAELGPMKLRYRNSRPASILMTLQDIDAIVEEDAPANPALSAISELKDADHLAWIEMEALDHLLLAHEHAEASSA